MSPSQRRVLAALVDEGPRTAKELAGGLGISAVAVRQHLTSLSAVSLVEPESVDPGIGRPARRWRATAAAQGSLSDGHVALSTEILRALAAEGLVDRVLERRTATQLTRYERAIEGGDLPARIAGLARIRTEEGYMARSWSDGDGAVCLAENHCPIRCAVDSCLGLCTAELDLFRRFAGPGVAVERTEHIESGDRRCVYRFTTRGD